MPLFQNGHQLIQNLKNGEQMVPQLILQLLLLLEKMVEHQLNTLLGINMPQITNLKSI